MVESQKSTGSTILPESAATGAAAGLSALGSVVGLCCLGPWTAAFFGVGGAIFLSRLAPFRPLFIIAAGGFLAWAFWRVYRPQAGGEAPRKTVLKTALWISAGLLALAVLAPDLPAMVMAIAPSGARP